MTTGHALQGYDPVVTNVIRFRSKSADPTMCGYRYRGGTTLCLQDPALNVVDSSLLNQIRREAQQAWEEEMKDWTDTPDKRPTTYAHSFYRKGPVKSEDPVIMRPISPTRRHKPHPKGVFITCHLQKVPGYHDPNSAMGQKMNEVQGFQNPDTTVKEDVYLVDALCSGNEQNERQKLRQKYVARPHTVSSTRYQHSQRESLKRVINDPRSVQSAEAWMKLANERDRQAAQSMINEVHAETRRTQHMVKEQKAAPFHASVHRYLKTAGYEEARAAERLRRAIIGPKPLPMSGPHFHITDYSKPIKIHPRHTRTDFTYHPDFYP